MKHKLLFLAIATVIFLLIAGCSQSAPPAQQGAQPPAGTPPSSNASAPQPPAQASPSTVTIENFAFSPSTITVKVGATVTWLNKDSAPHQIASNPHPAHTDLPGLFSGILSNGQSYSFTFNQTGAFGYHCHVHPSMTGTVVVEA